MLSIKLLYWILGIINQHEIRTCILPWLPQEINDMSNASDWQKSTIRISSILLYASIALKMNSYCPFSYGI